MNIKVVWYEQQHENWTLLWVDYLDRFKKNNTTPIRYRLDIISQEYITKLIKLLNADNEECLQAFKENIERELSSDAPWYTIYN